MLNPQDDEKDKNQPKTPLEMVRETQERQQATLAEGRAEAEGKAASASTHEAEEARVDTTPEVPGQGPPSSMRTHPQRSNQSHNQ